MQILIAIWLQKHYGQIIEGMDIEDVESIVNKIEYDWNYNSGDEYQYISEWLLTIDVKEYF